MNTTPTSFIYALVDPRTLLVRYVGQTSVGMRRPKGHRYTTGPNPDTYCKRWIKSLQRLGLTYNIAVLETLDSPNGLDRAECWWIAFGKACGWPLTNLTPGGSTSEATREERRKQKALAKARRTEDKAARARQRIQLSMQREARKTAIRGITFAHNPGELTARSFKLFNRGLKPQDAMVALGLTLDQATKLHEGWIRCGKEPKPPPALAPLPAKELEPRGYALFCQGKTNQEVALELHETSDRICELREKWSADGVADLVISDVAKKAFEQLIGPFRDVTELLERLTARVTLTA